jgi:hypothetical protein
MPSQIVMPYRGALPCPVDISSAATVLYYKVVSVWVAVACHVAAGPVALRWDVSNDAAGGLLLLVTLLLVQVALLLRCCCAGLCPMLLLMACCCLSRSRWCY